MKILMVCLGNICRSPLAEGILQSKIDAAGLHWEVDSAGTNGYHIGERPHKLSQKVATMNGVEINAQKSRLLLPQDFERFDKIYAMAADVVTDMKRIGGKRYQAAKVDLLMNELNPGSNQDIPDPWYGTEPGYQQVFSMIDNACEALLSRAERPLV